MSFTATLTPSSGKAPLPVLFTYSTDEAFISIKWYFGDGENSSELNPKHIYTTSGTFNYSAVMTYWDGGTNSYLTATDTGSIVIANQISIAVLDKCYCFGIQDDQGKTPREYNGAYWIEPAVGDGSEVCVDEFGLEHIIMFNNNIGGFFEISEQDGPTSSNSAKTWVDEDLSGTGHDIQSEIHFKDFTGAKEYYKIEHDESHFHFKPYDPAVGFKNGSTVDVDLYVDDSTTPTDTAANISIDNEVGFFIRKIGKRIRVVARPNMAQWILSRYTGEYWIQDESSDPDTKKATAATYQKNMSLPTFWVTRGSNLAMDICTGVVGSQAPTAATGPDGKALSAATWSGASTFGNVAITNGTIIGWATTSAARLLIAGVEQWGQAGTTQFGVAVGGFYLFYITGVTASGQVSINCNAATIFDIRIFNSALDLVTIADYYNDIVKNAGKSYLPIW